MNKIKPSPPHEQLLFKRPHRLARATLVPRAIGVCHTFGLTLWIASIDSSGWSLILPGLLMLLWPGVAYLHAAIAQNSKRAEFRNMLADSFLFGIWCGVLDFYVLGTITIGLACLMNNMVVGGLRRMMSSMALFVGGALAWTTITGFDFRPQVGTGLDIYQAPALWHTCFHSPMRCTARTDRSGEASSRASSRTGSSRR
ncbi:MASE2 domain-containing protein [Halomonas sp. BC04]|uniref:MASE2 domain-containing protein n=1 Tax=Halomonas sp. BC04 TaxID=1403540 RepID=UPI0003ED6509|nr:MASE2 domain-containing protein [Halomonas sp. BC04]EWH01698.1 hypothetical protein Q427_12750 [Halomonas sp. BC04]